MFKTLSSLTIAAFLMATTLAAQASENCPAVSTIEQVSPGVYRANGKEGEWSGVRQGVIASKTPINAFKVALAIQEDRATPQTLQHCTYEIGTNDTLDMRFIAHTSGKGAIKTQGSAWKQENGPFGLIYNVCENTAPETCTFTLVQ
ncbi:hypothetical protein BZK31_27755 [Pseudomonas floridensis]|uniref:DUF3757 domain-containing protein n=1 Tax=Pseudomonas floridensis TaxID=1958950 RepID=A0A1X0MSH4_9PSED|nr:DUF3757 domain-containing protein [Pseudomonas floridensis]ORC51192.1 hypothetical protein BZK31_27755 [Pseudomonas floridensis]